MKSSQSSDRERGNSGGSGMEGFEVAVGLQFVGRYGVVVWEQEGI